ncbi:MAG: hypothetical protein NT155_02315 [Candidatus Staskawiczbacteria bacterium]|nr:hypothetical protein [Candidatus Staskawiczbacteria bacterium]
MNNSNIEPPIGLLEKILKRIHREERILVIRRVIIFSILLIGSLLGFIPSLRMLVSDFNQSGFSSFFSLVFSDFSLVSAYWKNFMIILLETLPAASLALFLAVLLIILESIKLIAKDVKIIKSHHLMAN